MTTRLALARRVCGLNCRRIAPVCLNSMLHAERPRWNSTGVPNVLVYDAPLAKSIKSMKMFTLGSLGLTGMMAPIILSVDPNPDSLVLQTLIATVPFLASALSTALIQWCVKPYVFYGRAEGTQLELETLDWLARRRVWHGSIHDLDAAATDPSGGGGGPGGGRMFANVCTRARDKRGNPRHWFYVHPEGPGAELWKLLLTSNANYQTHKTTFSKGRVYRSLEPAKQSKKA